MVTQSDAIKAQLFERLAVDDAVLNSAMAAAVQRDIAPDAVLDVDSIEVSAIDVGVASGTAGVWRVQATDTNGNPAHYVLKGLWNQPGEFQLWDTTSGANSEPFHWLREARVYSAKLLENPAFEGIRSPRFYANVTSLDSLRERRAGFLIEEVDGLHGKDMSLDDFAVVAERLGRMQGHFLLANLAGNGLREPWLSKGYLREYVRRVDEGMMTDPDNAIAWDNPLLAGFQARRQDGTSVREATTQLWNDRATYLDVLDQLPTQTVTHNDLWYGQVILDENNVLVLDFAALGKGPMGADLGKLAVEVNARDFNSVENIAQTEAVLFDSYLAGLDAAGVDVDEPLIAAMVQLGWSAGVAAGESYRMGADWVPLLADRANAKVIMNQWGERSPQQVFDYYLLRSERLLFHAERAQALAREWQPVLDGTVKVTLHDVATPEAAARATAITRSL